MYFSLRDMTLSSMLTYSFYNLLVNDMVQSLVQKPVFLSSHLAATSKENTTTTQ